MSMKEEYEKHRGNHINLLRWLRDHPEIYDSKESVMALVEIEYEQENPKEIIITRLLGRYRSLLKKYHDGRMAKIFGGD